MLGYRSPRSRTTVRSKPKPRSKYLMLCGWCLERGETDEAAAFNPYQTTQKRGPEKDCACPLVKHIPMKRSTKKAT